ncbi:MAG: MBL fold metallo-hydrolase [Spirochaetota bacterium]|nr:MBL fold metallo-hydrolase [Spirochaetota bacterium]
MSETWRGKEMDVDILYSKAGIATQILITDRLTGDHLLVDCGDGCSRDLVNHEIDVHNLKGILITHGHADHVGGLYSLLTMLRLFQFKDELTVFAPSTCEEAFALINIFLTVYNTRIPYTLHYHELNSGVFESLEHFIIKPFAVLHYESTDDSSVKVEKPSFGYRITLREETVVISGDSLPCQALEEEVAGVDLAVIEATYDENFFREPPNHLDLKYAKYLGESAKCHILIHRY